MIKDKSREKEKPDVKFFKTQYRYVGKEWHDLNDSEFDTLFDAESAINYERRWRTRTSYRVLNCKTVWIEDNEKEVKQ